MLPPHSPPPAKLLPAAANVFCKASYPDPPQRPRKGARPGNSASDPSCSSMRSSWLYFATLSDLDGAPVLICPHPVATARSEIVTSSVSPERWLITAV